MRSGVLFTLPWGASDDAKTRSPLSALPGMSSPAVSMHCSLLHIHDGGIVQVVAEFKEWGFKSLLNQYPDAGISCFA